MYYEINVSKNGRHLFATAKRSATTESEFEKVGKLLQEKFPESEGYSVAASLCCLTGKAVPLPPVKQEGLTYDEVLRLVESNKKLRCRKFIHNDPRSEYIDFRECVVKHEPPDADGDYTYSAVQTTLQFESEVLDGAYYIFQIDTPDWVEESSDNPTDNTYLPPEHILALQEHVHKLVDDLVEAGLPEALLGLKEYKEVKL